MNCVLRYTLFLMQLTIQGIVSLKSEGAEELEIRLLQGGTVGVEWHTFYRNISSIADQDAIACLVNNPKINHAFVITWVKNGTENNEEV